MEEHGTLNVQTVNALPDTPADTPPTARQRLRTQHREILRRVLIGETLRDIATGVGMAYDTVRVIVRSPLFQIALEELQAAADARAIDTAGRAAMERGLIQAAAEGLVVAQAVMHDPQVHPAVRSKNAFGFLDRAGYGPTRKVETSGDSFRTIIERLDEMERRGNGLHYSAEMRVSVRKEADSEDTRTLDIRASHEAPA